LATRSGSQPAEPSHRGGDPSEGGSGTVNTPAMVALEHRFSERMSSGESQLAPPRFCNRSLAETLKRDTHPWRNLPSSTEIRGPCPAFENPKRRFQNPCDSPYLPRGSETASQPTTAGPPLKLFPRIDYRLEILVGLEPSRVGVEPVISGEGPNAAPRVTTCSVREWLSTSVPRRILIFPIRSPVDIQPPELNATSIDFTSLANG